MARTQRGFEIDDNGKRHEFGGKVTRHQRKSADAGLIPWTEGPGTSRWKRFKRAAVG